MKTISSIIFIFILFFNYQSNAQDFKSFEKEGVSLDYPSDWEVVDVEKKKKENPNNPMIRSILLEITANKGSDETESIKALRLDMSGKNATLTDMQKFFEKMYSNSQGKIQILKKSDGEINGYEYKSMTIKSDVDEVQLLGVQRVLLDGQYAYVVSVSSPLADFASFKTTGNKILDSFEVE